MRESVNAVLAGIVIAAGLSTAGNAQANNFNMCLGANVTNVALNSQVSGIENGVVILDSNNNPVFKANNYYGNGAGSYWTSALPQAVSLNAGCYTFYFMTKSTAPSGSAGWMCNQPRADLGNDLTVVSGELGGVTTGFVLIPASPTGGTGGSTAACPSAS